MLRKKSLEVSFPLLKAEQLHIQICLFFFSITVPRSSCADVGKRVSMTQNSTFWLFLASNHR